MALGISILFTFNPQLSLARIHSTPIAVHRRAQAQALGQASEQAMNTQKQLRHRLYYVRNVILKDIFLCIEAVALACLLCPCPR